MSQKIITDTEEMRKERPTPRIDDLDKTQERMQTWFAERMPEAQDIKLSDFEIPQASGMSNITLLFNLEWRENGTHKTKSCVARVKPPGGVLVFEHYDIALQYKAMETVAKHVPVPALLGLEEDTSVIGSEFYIMEKIEGRVPPDIPPLHMDGWVAKDATPAQREAMWWNGLEAMSKVHKVDWRKNLSMLYDPERGGKSIHAQFLYKMERYMAWSPKKEFHLPEYRRAMQWLHDNCDEKEHTGLCWGDSRMGNTMFHPKTCEVVALFDWEMTDLCNPIKDLAWWCTIDAATSTGLGIKRLDGFPSEEETVRYWDNNLDTQGSSKQFHYHKVAALYYFGLILTRTMMSANNPDPVGGNFVTPMLKAALDELGAAPSS